MKTLLPTAGSSNYQKLKYKTNLALVLGAIKTPPLHKSPSDSSEYQDF